LHKPAFLGKQLVSPFRELKRKIKKRTKSQKTPNVPLKIESLEPHVEQPFIEEDFAITHKIKILREKFKTLPDSPPVIVIDSDDQHMWLSTRTVAPTPCYTIVQLLISDNFHIKEEAVKLRTFPFSLSGEAKTWLNELNEGTITSWNELREAFISQYFSPAKFKCLLNEIHSFHELDNETLVDAWLRMKRMLRTCYEHGLTKGTIIQIFYHGLDGPTQGILDTGGIFLYNTPNKAFKILEDKVVLKLDFSDGSQNPRPKPLFPPMEATSNHVTSFWLINSKLSPKKSIPNS
ncbi:reverse transcriptase domain-containing protein, partial [Tanacetum coccineum]